MCVLCAYVCAYAVHVCECSMYALCVNVCVYVYVCVCVCVCVFVWVLSFQTPLVFSWHRCVMCVDGVVTQGHTPGCFA